MIAVLGWIDRTEGERDRMRRIIQMFRQRDARDELGIGAIRDSIADWLFPGTSTIQTRLRYFLFVPWVYRGLEERRLHAAYVAEHAREQEIALIEALIAGGEGGEGIIGVDARHELQRLPSAIYWSGLGAWGIRRFPGSLDAYHRSFDHPPRADGDGEAGSGNWHDGLPEPPNDLFERTTFDLTDEEARFLRERIIENAPESLLAVLAGRDGHARVDYVWHHPLVPDLPERLHHLVGHAELFSLAMEGAVYLYNVMVAERAERRETAEEHRGRLTTWRDKVDSDDLRAWRLDAFWGLIDHPNHRITPQTRRFVEAWASIVAADPGDCDGPQARALIGNREKRKGPQSRLYNADARARWGGASGLGRLDFRWPIAKSYLDDLAGGAA